MTAVLPSNLPEIAHAVAREPRPDGLWLMRGDGFTIEIRQSTFASPRALDEMRLGIPSAFHVEVLGDSIPDAHFDVPFDPSDRAGRTGERGTVKPS